LLISISHQILFMDYPIESNFNHSLIQPSPLSDVPGIQHKPNLPAGLPPNSLSQNHTRTFPGHDSYNAIAKLRTSKLVSKVKEYKKKLMNEEPKQSIDKSYFNAWNQVSKEITMRNAVLQKSRLDQCPYEEFLEYTTRKVMRDSTIHDQLKKLRKIPDQKDLTNRILLWHTEKESKNNNSNELQIFSKMIQLKPLQEDVKDQIIPIHKNSETHSSDISIEYEIIDRNFYKRMRAQMVQQKTDGKTLEKHISNIKAGQSLKKQEKYHEFLEAIKLHCKEFYEFLKKKKKILDKLAFDAKSQIDQLGKKEHHEKERQEKERMRLLKANKFEDYMKLINEAKNERLLDIINQTNKYFEELGSRVQIQKKEAEMLAKKFAKGYAESNLINENILIQENGEKDEDDFYNISNSSDQVKINFTKHKKYYYNITHSINEEIISEPKLLIGGKLKSYQIQGLKWLVSLHNNHLNGILADEMGLGKTIEAIAMFCYLIERKNIEGPFLVVVPLTTLTNWRLEFDKWAPSIKKIIYKGDPTKRKLLSYQIRSEKFNVLLTTYEFVMKDKAILNRLFWQYIVVDEGHRMKNYKCKFAMTLGQHYQSGHRLLLTGTPLQNNLTELWALLNFLLPKIFSSSEDFEKWFNQPFSKIPDKNNLVLNEEEKLLIINRLHQVLLPFLLRREKKEVEQELPDKLEYVVKVELSAWQKLIYDQIKTQGKLNKDPSSGKIGTKSLMNTMMQLRKICNHPYLFLNQYDSPDLINMIWKVSGKFELLDRMLPKLISTNHKILIFSQMTQLMDILQNYFYMKGIKHLRLDGSTKADDRGESTIIFNNENSIYKVFLLSTRAGGQGLNLQAADNVILFDSDFNPQMDLQAEDRAHRIGQVKEVRVYRLITKTRIEEDILLKATQKKNIDDAVIHAGMYNQKANDSDRRKRVEEILKKEEVNEDEENEIPTDQQLNEMLARNEKEFELFEKMDRERYVIEKKDEALKLISEKMGISNVNENYNYRLTQEYELPSWLIIEEPKVLEENTEEYGIGKRKRKQVNYAEDWTERQWDRIFEEGPDAIHEIEKMRQRKKKRISAFNENESEENLNDKAETDSPSLKVEIKQPLEFVKKNLQITSQFKSSNNITPLEENNIHIYELDDVEEINEKQNK